MIWIVKIFCQRHCRHYYGRVLRAAVFWLAQSRNIFPLNGSNAGAYGVGMSSGVFTVLLYRHYRHAGLTRATSQYDRDLCRMRNKFCLVINAVGQQQDCWRWLVATSAQARRLTRYPGASVLLKQGLLNGKCIFDFPAGGNQTVWNMAVQAVYFSCLNVNLLKLFIKANIKVFTFTGRRGLFTSHIFRKTGYFPGSLPSISAMACHWSQKLGYIPGLTDRTKPAI